MVWTCYFEKFVDMVVWLSRLAFDVMLSGRNILLVRAICFLIITVAASNNCDSLGVPFCPILSSFASGFRRSHPRCFRALFSQWPEQRWPEPPPQATPWWSLANHG
jgi:hypothetical protein